MMSIVIVFLQYFTIILRVPLMVYRVELWRLTLLSTVFSYIVAVNCIEWAFPVLDVTIDNNNSQRSYLTLCNQDLISPENLKGSAKISILFQHVNFSYIVAVNCIGLCG
jgi:hypothetical protein